MTDNMVVEDEVNALSYKALSYRKDSFWVLIFGLNVLLFFLGPIGYGEPILMVVFFFGLVPALLSFALMSNLDLMKSRGKLPPLKVFLPYVKRLSVLFTMIGMLLCLPWTFFWSLCERQYSTYPIPTLPLVSALLYVMALIPLGLFGVGYLTYSATRMVDPKYRDLFKTWNFIDDMHGTSLFLQFAAVPLVVSLTLLGLPLLYVADVLVGKEQFPYPDLLLNLTALWVIMFPLVLGLVLLYKSERVVARAIEEQRATA